MPHRPWILTLGMDAMVRGWESRTGMAVMPPLAVSSRFNSDLHDLMLAGNGKLAAVPGTGTFDVCDIADTALFDPQYIDMAALQSLAELYAGRRIVASGTVRLTADEWLERWNSLLDHYANGAGTPENNRAIAAGEADDADFGLGGFAQTVRRISAANVDAEARRKAAAAQRSALVGKTLELEGTALDGKPFDWNTYRGKTTLVEFWTTYSAESDALLAATRRFYELYGDVGLEVVGVNLDNDRQILDRFVSGEDIPGTILHTDSPGLEHLADQCGVFEVPMSVLVDRDGRVVWQAAGSEEFAPRLRDLLGPPCQGPLTCLDLQSQATWKLSERHTPTTSADNNLATLPRGERDFAGVKFNVGASALRLGSKRLPAEPQRIRNVPVDSSAAKLYFLHATGFGADENAAIGEYVIHYADGAELSIPILYGRDVRDWWTSGSFGVSARHATRATVAWRGKTPDNVNVQLFLSVWKNPRPATKIASLDYASAMTNAAPFCIAITAEGPVAARSAAASTTAAEGR